MYMYMYMMIMMMIYGLLGTKMWSYLDTNYIIIRCR